MELPYFTKTVWPFCSTTRCWKPQKWSEKSWIESENLGLHNLPLETTYLACFKVSFDIIDLFQLSRSSFVETLLLVINKGRTCKRAREKRWNSSKSCIGFFHWWKASIRCYFVPILCWLTMKAMVYDEHMVWYIRMLKRVQGRSGVWRPS